MMMLLFVLKLHHYTLMPLLNKLFLKQKRNYSGRFAMPPVDKETFIIPTELATISIIMLTHGGPYCQIDGLAMGSQPAPPLLNIWLSKFEPNI